ncbi:transcriptional regulatory protein ZraR [bacterium BMS3Bbin06]|nr:transcriptional regulatory protein ZraR [bacterium BMS3Abin08]GBE34503.1 transcriptional regulatory protein ZraR [bacterium BMS3Bbin06]
MEKILIIEDKKSMAEMLKATLSAEGFECDLARNGDDGIRMIQRRSFDLVITDLKLPGKDGLSVLREARITDPMLPVIIMTAYGTIEIAVEAIKGGAHDFITKPFDTDHLILMIKRALETRRLYRENILLKEEMSGKTGMPRIIGKSRSIMDVVEKVRKVACTKSTVLLIGESGTGKELFARAIHNLSPRGKGMFVPVNCAAIPHELIESDLFGHERGAFTGADSMKIGKFELADDGTIFLDEIGELAMSLQAKLLRVLQDQIVERVGGTRSVQVDVRVIAASNKNLAEEVREGRFREDLYYRLNVFPIVIPPLRDRREDIPMLAEYFIRRFAVEMKKDVSSISKESSRMLQKYDWKGNVRELENTIERAIILTDGKELKPEHIVLAPVGREDDSMVSYPEGTLEETAKWALRIAETRRIKQVLEDTRWNKTKAAEILKVSYKTLLTKIKEYNIE